MTVLKQKPYKDFSQLLYNIKKNFFFGQKILISFCLIALLSCAKTPKKPPASTETLPDTTQAEPEKPSTETAGADPKKTSPDTPPADPEKTPPETTQVDAGPADSSLPPDEEPRYLIYWNWLIFEGQEEKDSFIEITNSQGKKYVFTADDFIPFAKDRTPKESAGGPPSRFFIFRADEPETLFTTTSLEICLKIKESQFTGLNIKTVHKRRNCTNDHCPDLSHLLIYKFPHPFTVCNDCPKGEYLLTRELNQYAIPLFRDKSKWLTEEGAGKLLRIFFTGFFYDPHTRKKMAHSIVGQHIPDRASNICRENTYPVEVFTEEETKEE